MSASFSREMETRTAMREAACPMARFARWITLWFVNNCTVREEKFIVTCQLLPVPVLSLMNNDESFYNLQMYSGNDFPF